MDIVSIVIYLALPAAFLGLHVLERLFPARPLPRIAGWRRKGSVFLLMTLGLATVGPMLWMPALEPYRLVELGVVGTFAGALIAFVGTQLFVYWWHRALHGVTPLWRAFHQLHHSAERLDVFGANYLHPLDVLGFTFLQSAVPFVVFGVDAEAAVIAGLLGGFYSLFQHTNLRTPRWLGYVIQRPESHSVHHGRDLHAFNYADFPVWDIVFGTFRNPARFEAEAGFWDGASRRVGALLIGRDVSTPPAPPARAGATGAAA